MEPLNYQQTSKIFNPWFIFSFLPVLVVTIFLIWEGYTKHDSIDIICGILTFIISGGVLLLLLLQKMTLIIGPEGIFYNYYPSIRKYRKVGWSEISTIQIVTYNPIKDFGGWGQKVSKKYGKGYTTKGNKGLWIQSATGESVLLTIINPEEVRQQINRFKPGL